MRITSLNLERMRINELTKYIFIFGVLVFFDQLSKYLIRSKSGFYICNSGISWGIPVNNYVFVILWVVIVLFLVFLFFWPASVCNLQFTICKKIPSLKSQVPNPAIAFILAGAVSNMIDRVLFSCVIDFIDLKFWPLFNFADIFIALGAIFLVVGWKKV